MPVQCRTCSRVNPANAAYCYYDGTGLTEAALKGPLGLGTHPFPLPFSFSDGQGCANYNQLVLACDQRWSEARRYLVNGTWQSFFGTIGRTDLAALATEAARQTDPDIGLCRLLEGLPADVEALRPPKLALTSTVEDLGVLEPGTDSRLDLVIENQGMLLLCGSAMTDCDWLSLGDQGNASAKFFQTRDTFTLSVRVVGNQLRAGKTPREGQIVINTNGGCQTVTVRATVPIRPFRGEPANNVLAGALSPREIAVKAKAHPQEAAALFEQGVVKAWYQSNGWTYPIQGTQARGKAALQQFFEALGLTTPPRLEINTERINCQGEVGQRLAKKVTLRTTEAKFVHAAAFSDQDWVKVLPAVPHGNSVTLPVRIEIPPRPGETLHATVTLHGNGQQRFAVPVTLTVAAAPPLEVPEEERTNRGRRLVWSFAAGGILFLCLLVAVMLTIGRGDSDPVDPPPVEVGGAPPQQPPKVEAWWDDIPENKLTESVKKLKEVAREQRPLFERIQSKSAGDRRQGYEQLAAKLPELARNPQTREPLGQFVTECCVYEPSEFNIVPLLRGLAHQFPAEDSPFPPGDKGEESERASFWLQVVCDTITHKDARPDRSRGLASELNNVFGFPLDRSAPPEEFKDQTEKSLAQQCYHNLLPTAERSIEQALTIRDVLLARFSRHLGPAFRDQDDVKLLAIGLSRDNTLWPKLEPIFRTCVESDGIQIGFAVLDLYEKANEELAPKMERILAARWKAAANPGLTHAARARAIRKRLVAQTRAARVSYAERVQRLQALVAEGPLSSGKPGGQPGTTPLQDTVRLAHASTMACILFSKDAEVERFDALIARIPGSDQGKPATEPMPQEQPQQPGAKRVINLDNGPLLVQEELTDRSERDPRRGTFRKVYLVQMRSGQIYFLSMRSNDLKPYLRVESASGARLTSDQGASLRITFPPQTDGVYRVVASSANRDAVGRFTLQIQQPLFRFGIGMPGRPQAPRADEQKASALNPSDLADLGHKQGSVRIAAFKNLTGSIPNDLSYRYAEKLASYLLVTEWKPLEAELQAVTGPLPSLVNCRHLLEALADVIANGEKLAQQRTEAIVGGLLGQKLRFARDEDWRSACRKLLLQRALELTGHANNEADRTADFLRDLYKEQGLAFGLEDPAFAGQTQISPVLEALVKHVAASAAQQDLSPEEKTYLEQIDRQLQAARFVAQNDLEYVVLLQRIWLKVLTLRLQEGSPAETKKMMMLAVQQELDKKDRDASNLLDQLRSGEENLLRVWVLVHDLKVK
jgi:hypothetical protein